MGSRPTRGARADGVVAYQLRAQRIPCLRRRHLVALTGKQSLVGRRRPCSPAVMSLAGGDLDNPPPPAHNARTVHGAGAPRGAVGPGEVPGWLLALSL